MGRTYHTTIYSHQIQWKRPGYWSPGAKFTSEELAHEYAQLRVTTEKGGDYRVVPIERHGELSSEQCLVLMKCMHNSPQHWRAEVIRHLEKGAKPPAGLDEADCAHLLKMSQTYPLGKLVKLNAEVIRNRLKMADARERARDIAKVASDIVVLDHNPEVMPIEPGFFVQAWVFVPHRTEDAERERQHNLAAYMAGTPWADVA